MRIPLERLKEKAAAIAAKTGDREAMDLAELIHDLAEHLIELQAKVE